MSTSVRTTTVTETSERYDDALLLSVCPERSIREDSTAGLVTLDTFCLIWSRQSTFKDSFLPLYSRILRVPPSPERWRSCSKAAHQHLRHLMRVAFINNTNNTITLEVGRFTTKDIQRFPRHQRRRVPANLLESPSKPLTADALTR